MAPTIKVALIIQGNVNTDGGMQPLVSVGVFPLEELKSLDTAPMIKEGVSFKIKHCETCIIYKLTDVKVRPKDSARDGRFVLALAVPCRLQFAEGKSPYKLITDIYTKFVNENMLATSDGYHKFDKSDIDRDPYIELISQYAVEERSGAYIKMTPSGELGIIQAATDDKLEAIFRDSQYPEFRQFSELEIGRSCQPTINVEIPRSREYSIELNGHAISIKLQKEMDFFDSADFLKDEEYTTYKGQHVHFTLQEVLNGDAEFTYKDQIKLEGTVIKCKVNSVSKEFKFVAEIRSASGYSLTQTDQENIKMMIKNSQLKITFGNDDISEYFLTGNDYVVYGSAIKQLPNIIPDSTDDFQFTVEKRRDLSKFVLIVKKTFKPQPKPELKPVPKLDRNSERSGKKYSERTNYPVISTPSLTGYEIHFVNNSEKYLNDDLVAIVSSRDKKKRYLRQVLHFNYTSQNGYTVGHAHLLLDNDWEEDISSRDMSICLSYRSKNSGIIRQSGTVTPDFKGKVAEIEVHKLIFDEPKAKIPKLYYMIGSFLLGMIIAAGATYFMMKESALKEEERKEIFQQIADLKEQNDSLKNENERLRAENEKLSSGESASSSRKDEENPISQVTDERKQETLDISSKTADYKRQIVEAINNRSYGLVGGEKGKEGLLSKAKKAKQITKEQENAITAFWWGAGGPYSKAQRAKIDKELKGKIFKSINEVVDFGKQIPNIVN